MEDPRNAPARLHRVTFRLRRAVRDFADCGLSSVQRMHTEELARHLEDHIENMTHNIGMWSSTRLERSG